MGSLDSVRIQAVASLSERYRKEVLRQWLTAKERYLADWFEALDFLLSHVFFQGRRDELSERYYRSAKGVLRRFFGEPTVRARRFNKAWVRHWVPHDVDWTHFTPEGSPIIRKLRKRSAGKTRDQEMVLDILRFLRGLPDWNVVSHSVALVRKGKMVRHYNELQSIWQVGPKTAAFYLRDLCTLYDLEPSTDEQVTMQPIDTWVRQVCSSLGILDPEDDDETASRRIVRACERTGVSPSDFNAGAWYLGTHSLEIALERLGARG